MNAESPPPKMRLISIGLMLALLFYVVQTYMQDAKQLLPQQTPVQVAVAPPPIIAAVPDAPPHFEPAAPPAPSPAVPKQARIAIVIDDAGLSRAQTEPVVALPAPISIAFLPYGAATELLARKAKDKGHEVLVHMPMQPEGGENPGPDALMVGLSPAEAAARVLAAIKAVPGAVGLNNHMGSAATASLPLMQAIMPTLGAAGLFYVDSRTSQRSIAFEAAREAGVRAARRDVFLDNDPVVGSILAQLAEAEAVAKKRGHAIAIGHPYPETIEALQQWLASGLDTRGIVSVKVSELVE